MNKPKLLLNGGWSWAASSPLIYTLQRIAKYAHFGYTKTFRYLQTPKMKGDELIFISTEQVPKIVNRVCNGTWENYKSEEPSTHQMNLRIDLEPLDDFPHEHLKPLVTGNPTITKYMDYYHALHDHVISKGYKSVGDGVMGRNRFFVSDGMILPQRTIEEYDKQYHETLLSEFDVKIIFLARDPVRRAFSQYLHKVQKNNKSYPLDLYYWDYMKEIYKAYETFGRDNVHITTMEELWEGTAKSELSQFLDHPITNLWKNLYSPDRGHLVEFDKDVPCQAYGQNLAELTPEMYYLYKGRCQYIYDEWKDEFGSLPLYWGEPIEYKA